MPNVTQAETNPKASTNTDAELLASLGYKQEFRREFRTLEVFGISFSIISVLPSIASTLIYSIPSGGPISMIWGWLVTCFFIMICGLAMGDLASAMPTSGGLYYWTFQLSSRKYRSLLCWIVGYFNTLSMASVTASVDWTCAQMMLAAASIGTDGSYVPLKWHNYLLYLAILFCHGCLTSFGTRVLARLQGFAVVLNFCLAGAIIIALCVATPHEYRNDAGYVFGGWYNSTGWSDGTAFLLSMLMAAWTVSSYDSCVHISEEASNAARAVPLGIFASIVTAAIVGFGILIAIVFNMGTDLASIVASSFGQPMATILLNSLGKSGCLALWSFVIITQFFMGASCCLASSRQVFAFSRDGALPFSRWIYRINKRTQSPVNPAWFSIACCALLGLLGLITYSAVSAIFSLTVIGASIAYLIPILARLLAPKERFTPGPWYLGDFWSPIVAWVACAYLVFISVIVCLPSALPTTAAVMNYASLVTGALLIFALAWYYCPKYGGVHWFTGPKSNINIETLDNSEPSTSQSISSEAQQDEKEKSAFDADQLVEAQPYT